MRLVRLHLKDDRPSIEGFLRWRPGSHYRLLKASVFEAEDRSHSIDGETWVPRENVLFLQKLSK